MDSSSPTKLLVSVTPGSAGFEAIFSHGPSGEPHLLCALAVESAETSVAACCLYYNPAVSLAGAKTLLVGHFSCIDDEEVFGILMTGCDDYARENSYEYLLGPMNGSTWEDYRFAVEGTAPRFFTEPEQPHFYAPLWTNAGFEQIAGYYSSEALLDSIPAQWSAYEAAFQTPASPSSML